MCERSLTSPASVREQRQPCFLCAHNPAIEHALRVRKKLRLLGSDLRLIGNGNGRPDLNRVFDLTLLGCLETNRITDVDPLALTRGERKLLWRVVNGPPIQGLMIVDLDGVLVSGPVHSLVRGCSPFKLGGLNDFSSLQWLRRVAEIFPTVVWTSRFCDGDGFIAGRFAQGRNFNYFPFLSIEAQRFFSQWGEEVRSGGIDRIQVLTDKPLRKGAKLLGDIIRSARKQGAKPELVYYVMSSVFDENALLDFVRKRRTVPSVGGEVGDVEVVGLTTGQLAF